MKTYKYLETLPLTTAQKEQITTEGYENAPTLYMLCKATPVAMREFLGLDSLDALETALWEMLTAEERTAVEAELKALGN